MYVHMDVCMHICMNHVHMYECMSIYMQVWLFVCIYV